MSAVGFEPTRIAPPELESGALDRSAKLSVSTDLKRFDNATNFGYLRTNLVHRRGVPSKKVVQSRIRTGVTTATTWRPNR